MESFAFGAVDIVVLLVIAAVVALAIRTMRKDNVVSCGGDCSSCAGGCENPKLTLSPEQLAELDELDRKYGVSK